MASPVIHAVTFRRVTPQDWLLLRAVRLAMLLDTPSAFGSSFAEEVGLDDDVWRARARTPGWFALEEPGTTPLGAVSLVSSPGRDPELTAVWVAGHARGRGIAEGLLDAGIEQAGQEGAARVIVHVMASSVAAQRLYERAGFVATGECGRVEGCHQMALHLPRPGR